LEPRGIHVAEYLTELPPRKLLEQRLHDAIIRTRLRLEQEDIDNTPPTMSRPRRKKGTP